MNMKKRFLTSLLTLFLGISFIACGSKETETADAPGTGGIFETLDDAPDTDNKQQQNPASDLPEGVEFVSADGFYCGYLQSSNQDKIGAVDASGQMYMVIYDSKITDDNLVIYGNFGYKNFADQDIVSVSDKGIFAFTITDDTTFVLYGGEEPEYPTKDEFYRTLSDTSDSGLYFEVELSESVAKTVSISS